MRPLSSRCQLEQRALQLSSQIDICLPELTEHLCCSGTKRPPEFGWRQRPNERVSELRTHLGGQTIHPLRIACSFEQVRPYLVAIILRVHCLHSQLPPVNTPPRRALAAAPLYG
jgi:hypothetical protein